MNSTKNEFFYGYCLLNYSYLTQNHITTNVKNGNVTDDV